MTRFQAMCAFAILTMLMAGPAFAKGAADRSLIVMDGRFSGFDAIAHIRKNHPDWDGAAEAVSHWSAYYNVNPILVLHLLRATASPDVSVKTVRKTARILGEQDDLSGVGKALSLPANQLDQLLEDSREETSASGITHFLHVASDSPPALDLPFVRAQAWEFNGVHTWTGDNDGSPMSSIDFSSNWSERWGADTSNYFVAAAHDGVVTVHSSCFVTVRHDSGWATRYYHLDQLTVSSGQQVFAGQAMGIYADNEEQAICQGGHSAGPHLHFALMKDGSYHGLQDVALSGYVIHPGTSSYDANRERMWMDKRGNRYYAFDEAIQTQPGDNIIDYRYNGMWLPSGHDGHGFSVDIGEFPAEKGTRKTVFVAFYTYDDFGLANFYAGNVDFDRWRSDQAMVIDMLQTAGGDFTNLSPIDAADPDDVNQAGYVSLRFLDCNNAVADISLDERSSGQAVENSVELVKLIGVPDHVCEAASLPLESESGSANSQ